MYHQTIKCLTFMLVKCKELMMKRLWMFGLLVLGLAACGSAATREPETETPTPEPTKITTASLPDLGPAPELTNVVWLNVDAPLRLSDLRGKVVALEMWTFG